MSAFVCSEKHIATVAYAYCLLTNSMNDIQEVANKLYDWNVDSFNYRYNEDEKYENCCIDHIEKGLSTVGIKKIVTCLEYQSCEHPTWKRSVAYSYIKFIESEIDNFPELFAESKEEERDLWAI